MGSKVDSENHKCAYTYKNTRTTKTHSRRIYSNLLSGTNLIIYFFVVYMLMWTDVSLIRTYQKKTEHNWSPGRHKGQIV